ncbi:MAG: NADH:ubiquinone reductase (Na(+)-transporting) subunit A, partial [Planctomycetota bacterium]
MITIRRGLDLPISGEPDSSKAIGAKSTGRVGVVGPDFVGMKPTMHVAVGDKVRRGQLLFEDKKNAGVRHVAPAAGEVVEVNRGAKRVFQSVVIA